MKWNWGTGIFIVIVLFLGACISFIIWSQTQKWSLVEEDYYPRELRHEEKLVKIRNATALTGELQVRITGAVMTLQFPADFRGKTLSGTIDIYRPSDEKLDVILPVKVDSSLTQAIPLNKLSRGRYIVKVDWTSLGKGFFKELDLFVP